MERIHVIPGPKAVWRLRKKLLIRLPLLVAAFLWAGYYLLEDRWQDPRALWMILILVAVIWRFVSGAEKAYPLVISKNGILQYFPNGASVNVPFSSVKSIERLKSAVYVSLHDRGYFSITDGWLENGKEVDLDDLYHRVSALWEKIKAAQEEGRKDELAYNLLGESCEKILSLLQAGNWMAALAEQERAVDEFLPMVYDEHPMKKDVAAFLASCEQVAKRKDPVQVKDVLKQYNDLNAHAEKTSST